MQPDLRPPIRPDLGDSLFAAFRDVDPLTRVAGLVLALSESLWE
jgi:hypothetical protein